MGDMQAALTPPKNQENHFIGFVVIQSHLTGGRAWVVSLPAFLLLSLFLPPLFPLSDSLSFFKQLKQQLLLGSTKLLNSAR